jgi:hypothetical protein
MLYHVKRIIYVKDEESIEFLDLISFSQLMGILNLIMLVLKSIVLSIPSYAILFRYLLAYLYIYKLVLYDNFYVRSDLKIYILNEYDQIEDRRLSYSLTHNTIFLKKPDDGQRTLQKSKL